MSVTSIEIPQRLGETYEWGEMLLRLVELAGWKVERATGFGGGVLLFARNRGREVTLRRDTFAEAALALHHEVFRRVQPAVPEEEPEQLTIDLLEATKRPGVEAPAGRHLDTCDRRGDCECAHVLATAGTRDAEVPF